MMCAWWIFGSTAILSARYLKGAESTCCMAPLWWALHRPLMLMAFVCATVAFFFIYYISGWRVRTCNVACTTDDYLGQLHAIIGTVTWSLMAFQVLLGAIRTSVDHPIRPLFNWLHWMCGSSAWICALTFIATVFICEYFHRKPGQGEKSASDSSLSPVVPLVIVCNLLVAIAAVAVITWMLVQAYEKYGFT
ncbi:hypothetical protein PMAYCL1PPCAC_31347, partial [Pristionchus mayeri]